MQYVHIYMLKKTLSSFHPLLLLHHPLQYDTRHTRAEPKLLAYAYSAIAPRAIAPSMPTIAVARAPAPELVWDPSVLVWLGLEDEAVRVEVMDATRSRINVSIGTRDWNL